MDRRLACLDGVRAFAILAVLAAHTGIAGVRGGFVGVDVFFVLSGFLITSLLVAEYDRTGRIDLPAFLARRARRLLPAALVMIVTVLAAGRLFSPDAIGGLRGDAVSAALWSNNWRLALRGVDYFSQGGAASPLQHTWSLAVEEQFYLVWPVLVVLICAAGARLMDHRRRLLVVTVAGAAVSALVTLILSGDSSAGRVYFGTDTRAQELLIGAALAAALAPGWQAQHAAAPDRSLARRALPLVASGGGLLVLGVAAHRADGAGAEFRHGLMLWVALASAALIAGVVLDERTPIARLLTTPPLVAIGTMSYGLYLWHWPVFRVLDGERTGLGPLELAVVRILVSVVLAGASLLFVELPVRRLQLRTARLLPAAAGGIAAVLAFAACAGPSATSVRSTASPPGALDAPAGAPGPSATSGSRTSRPAAPQTPQTSRTRSSSRHGGPLVVDVFGDSIAWTLVRYLPPTPGIRVVDHTVLGCGLATGGPYRYFGQQYPGTQSCDQWPARWQAQVAADRPDVVLLLVGRWETMDRVYRGTWTHLGDRVFDNYLSASLDNAISRLESTGSRVILANEPYNRRGEQPDGQLYPEDSPARVDTWNSLVRHAVQTHADTKLLDLNVKLCPDGQFTWSVDGIQVRSDGVHLTADGVAWLAPWLATQVRADRP
jgi:peptidoglycan/LPS O-acetylase OafA/YrhL